MLMKPRDNYGFDFFDEIFRTPFFNNKSSNILSTDVREKDGNYILDIELPGFKKEEININLSNGYLSIAASKNSSTEEKSDDGKYIRQERHVGQCQRSFYIGKAITDTDIKASYTDGILQLIFPTSENKQIEQKKYIEIN